MSSDKNPFLNFDIGKFDVQKIFADFKIPGVDMEALLNAQKKNIAALTQANLHAVEGMQALAQRKKWWPRAVRRRPRPSRRNSPGRLSSKRCPTCGKWLKWSASPAIKPFPSSPSGSPRASRNSRKRRKARRPLSGIPPANAREHGLDGPVRDGERQAQRYDKHIENDHDCSNRCQEGSLAHSAARVPLSPSHPNSNGRHRPKFAH
jgi:hypothetical protein